MGFRTDRQPLGNVERTGSGAIRVVGRLSRTGLQTYRNADGSTRVEYRPPEEVFRADALAALRGLPVTLLHPRQSHGIPRVDASTWSTLSTGHVGDDVRQDGDYTAATLTISDAKAIARVEAREVTELSVGYDVDYDPTPGTTPSGERYDGVQRNIRPNHVALVPRGRAGREASLRLDADDNERLDGAEEIPNVKIKIAGKEFEAGSPEATAALAALESQAARADAAEATIRSERSKRIRGEAKRVGVELRADAEDGAIMLEVIKKIAPDVDLASASPEMIEGAFRVAISLALKAMGGASAEKPKPAAPPGEGANAVRADAVDAAKPKPAARDDADAMTAEDIRQKQLEAWRAAPFKGLV